MPQSINGRQIFERMGGEWPKSSEEIVAWARTHEEFPNRFLDELSHSLPDQIWQNWDELRREVENYTWTWPEGEEDVVWGGAEPETEVLRRPEPGSTVFSQPLELPDEALQPRAASRR
jgi:hypothetical protein